LRGSCRLTEQALVEHTARLRLTMTSSERARLEEMDRKQKAWVDNERGRIAEAEREDLGGRTSGPADWRANRDELGIPRITKPSVTGRVSCPCNNHVR
jgi:peptide-N4-(N-acetyl-beta-glucosaminyl)asparagine amidase